MIAETLAVSYWPHVPPLPPTGEPALVRVPTSRLRAAARQQLRDAARAILALWADLSPTSVVLRESPHGPDCLTAIRGSSVVLSFSYTEDFGWIAFLRGGAIGVDAIRVRPFADIPDVARLYLGPAALADIQRSPNPPHRFARHWTALEARIKLSHGALVEWPSVFSTADFPLVREHVLEHADTVVTVVTAISRGPG
jgi:phosphopantetheinyl transferase